MKKFEQYPLYYYTIERIYQYIFENLLDKKFLFCKLLFLKEMQLDKYNKKLYLTFKFQKFQYYYYNSLYH